MGRFQAFWAIFCLFLFDNKSNLNRILVKNVSSKHLFLTSTRPFLTLAGEAALMSKKRKRLDSVVSQLQRQFGPQALNRGERAFDRKAKVETIPTGFAALDAALDSIGGVPCGHLTEILSVQTAGAATLALKVMAKAQVEGGLVTYVELAETFDPDYAARCGVQMSRSNFLLVNPTTVVEALEIIQALLTHRSSRVLVFDMVSSPLVSSDQAQRLALLVRQLPQILPQSNCALIFLTSLESSQSGVGAYLPGLAALPHFATLRLLLRKERWLIHRNDIRGYESRATVLKNKLGQAGRSASIAITFNGVVEGDGT